MMWMLKNSGSTLDSRQKAQSLTLMDDRKTRWWMEKRRNDLEHVQPEPCLPEDTHTNTQKKNQICLPVNAVPSVPCPGGLVILLRGSCTSGLPVSSTTEFQWAVIVAVIFFLPLYVWHVCHVSDKLSFILEYRVTFLFTFFFYILVQTKMTQIRSNVLTNISAATGFMFCSRTSSQFP